MAMDEELTPEIVAARARLRARCSQTQQIGGKGTARRKTKKTHKSVVGDDKKLQLTLKRLGVASIYGVEELFLQREDGSALYFTSPKVQAAPAANTYVVSGQCEERANATTLLNMRGLLGGGLDSSSISPEMLRQLHEHVEALNRKERDGDPKAKELKRGSEGDDDVPDLVENFEEASNK